MNLFGDKVFAEVITINGITSLDQVASGKDLPANIGDAGDVGLILWLGRSPGEGNDNPLRYSCLRSPMDRGALPATVHGPWGLKTVYYDLASKQQKQHT